MFAQATDEQSQWALEVTLWQFYKLTVALLANS